MKTNDFYYELPEELIAQRALDKRTDSRLMVIDREHNTIDDRCFKDILEYINPGDVIVLNESRVMSCRLFGHRPGKEESIEVLLIKETPLGWEAMVKPGKKLKVGSEIIFSKELKGTVADITDIGTRIIDLEYEGILQEILDKIGEMPTPPYIKEKLEDQDRYQTVYASDWGSAAAPTAGLHFDEDTLENLKNKGVKIARVTLHVGLGTFRPVFAEDISEHVMHSEYYYLDSENAQIINSAIENGGKLIAVGTTVVRALESIYQKYGKVKEASGDTDIFIFPGYKFNVIDELITNFHLPESTLLMLVSAFYDREKILEAYNKAIELKYRFFSFGDCMMIR